MERERWIDGVLKKQEEGYYSKLGLPDPFDGKYDDPKGTLRDKVVYGKTMPGPGLKGPFDLDFKTMMESLKKHPKIEGRVIKTSVTPKIDGVLDDLVWANAPKLGMFKDDGSGEALVPTEVQIAYDRNAVYITFTVHEPAIEKMKKNPDKVSRNEGAEWEDSVEVFLGEPGKDARKWVHMIVSFTGARYDGRFGFVTDDKDPLFTAPDSGWTAPWESAVKVDTEKKQWMAELAIPWSTLGFGEPKEGTVLLANFTRTRWTESNPKDGPAYSAWSATFGGDFQDSSRFGTLKLEP
jgi:hypothetical protein